MKANSLGSLISIAAAAMCASAFGAISDPEPDTRPASEFTWDDFGGATRNQYSNWDAKDQTYNFANGIFNMKAVSWQKGMTLNIGDALTFNSSGQWHGPTGGTTDLHTIRIFNGGTFNVTGSWDPNWTHLQVDQGGTFMFKGTSLQSDNSTAKQSWFDVYGVLDVPAGLTASAKLRMDIITHEDSEIRLGGNVSKNGRNDVTLRWLVKGGTITALENVTFDCNELEFAPNAAVTLSVAEGKSFDLAPFTLGDGASVAKTGAGAVLIGAASPVAANAGIVVMGAAGGYDLSAVTVADGASLKVGTAGVAITAYDNSLLQLERLDLDSSLVADGALVLTACDATLTAWAVEAIGAGLPSDFEAYADGNLVKIRLVVAAKSTAWTGAGADGNWSTAGNWTLGVPAVGDSLAFGASAKTATVNDIAGLTVANVAFGADAPAYEVGGSQALTVYSSISNLSDKTQTFGLPMALSGTSVELYAKGDVAFSTLAGGSTPLVKEGEGTVAFNEGYAGVLAVNGGRVVVPAGKKLTETTGALTVNGVLDLGGGSLTITQPASQVASIGDGAVLTNGTFTYKSEKVVYNGSSQTGRAFMWTNGVWTIAKGATVITDGQIFEYGPDAPGSGYGARKIVVDGGELRCTSSSVKYVIGVDYDFSKPAVVELKNGALLKATGASEFHIGARNSGNGTSKKARSAVIATESTIEINDQLRMLNEHNGYKPNSATLALTNSVLSLVNSGKTHEINSSGSADSEANFILSHSTASFFQMKVYAREGTWSMAGRKTGVMTLDGATLRPLKAAAQFIYNNQAVPAIELQQDGATIDTAYDITIPAAAYGVGALTKAGTGTLTLSSTNAYEGATVVEAGTLKLTGVVAGAVEVGANGTLEMNATSAPTVVQAASLAFAPGSKLKVAVSGKGPSYPFMLLKPGATVTGNPTFEVTGSEVSGRLRIVTKQTADGVLCSIAPTGFALTIH